MQAFTSGVRETVFLREVVSNLHKARVKSEWALCDLNVRGTGERELALVNSQWVSQSWPQPVPVCK